MQQITITLRELDDQRELRVAATELGGDGSDAGDGGQVTVELLPGRYGCGAGTGQERLGCGLGVDEVTRGCDRLGCVRERRSQRIQDRIRSTLGEGGVEGADEHPLAIAAEFTGVGDRLLVCWPGNLGCQMWTRDRGDGRTEVLTVSWWESHAAIIGFAGSDIEAAVFYPEDDEYLVDRETTVSHFEVAAAQAG
jgi:heme-degrading monooxygenase HmoA